MRTTDKYVFFWNGIYSQWHPSDFRVDGFEYSTCEQYMMHQKALLFKDFITAKEIMKTHNPREQKRLGRQVQDFDRTIWDAACFAIVYKGNYAKFSQNPALAEELKATGSRLIVEASPVDKIWGIGMGEEDDGIEDPANWKGLNMLGNCIMAVRNTLFNK